MGYGLYANMDDDALLAEINVFRQAIRKQSLSGVGVIAGEGRRIEFTNSNISEARTELRNLMAEARRRGLSIADGFGGAIAVEIG